MSHYTYSFFVRLDAPVESESESGEENVPGEVNVEPSATTIHTPELASVVIVRDGGPSGLRDPKL